ncbi:MAG TPA: carbohydrate ABC transporter substrate-binding protein [Cellulomonadaceae bacterium]|nr:carbohydrate ABC transporter substrate-binding protein [Cellulomonadaceae bacterium]
MKTSLGVHVKKRKLLSVTTAVTTLSIAGLVLSGCSSASNGTTGSAGSQTDSGGKITVWVDAPRMPAADAFKTAHPEIPINIVQIDSTVGATTTQQRFAQFDAAKKGWPDAIFFPSNDDVAWAAKTGYTANMSKDTPDLVAGYTKTALASCYIDGAYQCLRNDAAPDVLWYNAALFKQWGYTVPKTWAEYTSLAVTIAKDHPGYISGFTGDAYAPNRYLWASDCPTNVSVNPTTVQINLQDPKCTRAESMLSTLTAAKALSTDGIFDADAATVGQKLVMSPGAVWWGDYLFQQTWKLPAKTMQASPTGLSWDGSTAQMGDEGGGLWGMSSHITGKELANAEIFMKFVVSDPAWQVNLSTGLPAFTAMQQPWLTKQASNDFYYDTAATLATFAPAINTVPNDYSYLLYDTGGEWTSTVAKDLAGGKDFATAWTDFGTDLVAKAKAAGYTVVTTK